MDDSADRDPLDTPPPAPRARPVAPDETELPVLAYARRIAPTGPLDLPMRPGTAALDMAIVLGVLLMTMILPSVALMVVDPTGTLARSPEIGIAITATFGVAVGALAIILHRWRGLPFAAMGIRSESVNLDLLIGFGTFVACLVTRMAIGIVLATLSEDVLKSMEETGERLQMAFPKMPIGRAFAIATLVGIYEETVFRGFVLPRMKRLVGSWWLAILVSSVIFALLHAYQGPAGMAMVFMLAIVLGIVFVWRQSLLPCIVAHSVTDFVSLVLLSQWDNISRLAEGGAAP